MAARTCQIGASLTDKIDILNKNIAEGCHANQVFRTVSAILALVKDKMTHDKDSVQLSEYCFGVCETLKNAIQGGDLSEPEKVGMEDLERAMCEIERTLRRGASSPYTKHKEKLESCVLRIKQTLGTYHALGLAPHRAHPGVDKHNPLATIINSHGVATTSAVGDACGRLIRRTFFPHEFASLIDAILSSKDEIEIIRSLPSDNAQTLIDVIDKALGVPGLSLQTRNKSIKLLYRTCGHHALLPGTLRISAHYNQTGNLPRRGGYADVWKGDYRGQDVAVKVIRTYSNRELGKVINRFCKEVVAWRFLQHQNVLPLIGVMVSENLFAMVSGWMQNGDINEFVRTHPDANRFELLADVAEGLLYLHDNGMVHGDLKGANILIDETGHARLADFGLLTIIFTRTNPLPSGSGVEGGTVRWMSPELIAPQRFGLKGSYPTKSSDRYALGMVIYETIRGRMPFHKDTDIEVSLKVIGGECPPRTAKFSESLWKMLKRCWISSPDCRPSIKDVLQCLKIASESPLQPPVGSDEESEIDGDYLDWDSSEQSSNGTGGVVAAAAQSIDQTHAFSQPHLSPSIGDLSGLGLINSNSSDSRSDETCADGNDWNPPGYPFGGPSVTTATTRGDISTHSGSDYLSDQAAPRMSTIELIGGADINCLDCEEPCPDFIVPRPHSNGHDQVYETGATNREIAGCSALIEPSMASSFEGDVERTFWDNMNMLVPAQDAVNDRTVPYASTTEISLSKGVSDKEGPESTDVWELTQSLPESHSRKNGVCIPQRRWTRGAGRNPIMNQGLVLFLQRDGSYLPLSSALAGDCTDLVLHDSPAIDEDCFVINVRFEWPGYPSWDSQLRTRGWTVLQRKISLSRMGTEVGKSIRRFMTKMREQDIAPEHAVWKIGPGGIQLEDIHLAALEQVSAGSWQPRLFYKPRNL